LLRSYGREVLMECASRAVTKKFFREGGPLMAPIGDILTPAHLLESYKGSRGAESILKNLKKGASQKVRSTSLDPEMKSLLLLLEVFP